MAGTNYKGGQRGADNTTKTRNYKGGQRGKADAPKEQRGGHQAGVKPPKPKATKSVNTAAPTALMVSKDRALSRYFQHEPRVDSNQEAVNAFLRALAAREAAPAEEPSLEALLPSINVGDYVGPYDQAADAARAAHAAVIPEVEGTYARLAEALRASNADAQGQFGTNRQALVDQLARSRQELDGIAQLGAGSPHVQDANLLSAFNQEMGARQAAQQQAADGRLALADRFAQISQQSNDSRISDADLAKSAALANAGTNLQQLLSQIGLKRADAERQFANDSADRNLKEFELKRRMAEDERQHSESYLKELDSAATTPRRQFEANYAALSQTYPKAISVFEMLTKAAGSGKGPMAYAKAKRLLEQQRKALESGTLPIDENGTPIGARINVDKLDAWLQAYYDDETSVVPDDIRAEIDARYGR